jgi:hypothetical protein
MVSSYSPLELSYIGRFAVCPACGEPGAATGAKPAKPSGIQFAAGDENRRMTNCQIFVTIEQAKTSIFLYKVLRYG